jgi:hypothetical protein
LLKCNFKDGVILLHSKKVAVIEKIVSEQEVIVKIFNNNQKIFSYPCDSVLLSISEVDIAEQSAPVVLSVNEILCKCAAFKQINTNFVVLPLIHSS